MFVPVGRDVPGLAVDRLGAPVEPAGVVDLDERGPVEAVVARRPGGGKGLGVALLVWEKVEVELAVDLTERRVAVLAAFGLEYRHLIPRTRVLRTPEKHAASGRSEVIRGGLVAEVEPAVPEGEVGVRVVCAVRDGVPRLEHDLPVNLGLLATDEPMGEATRCHHGCELRAGLETACRASPRDRGASRGCGR